MSLPRSIQQQAEMANAHFNAIENPEPDKGKAPDPAESERTATDTDAQSADTQAAEDAAKHSQEEAKPERDAAYWEHRFNVINGKYAAEVPALRDEIATLKQQLADKSSEIESLKAAPSTPETHGLTEEQLEQSKDQFGEDFVSFVDRMISSKAPAQDTTKVAELERKIREIEEGKRQALEASFWTALSSLVPNWKEINVDPKFHAYLAQFDPQTGRSHQDTLVAAQSALDADAVAAVFNAFTNQPQQKPEIPKDQIDPPASRATTTPSAQKVWTGAEIKQFYVDKSRGKYTPEEAKRLEADIFQAQAQGRIR